MNENDDTGMTPDNVANLINDIVELVDKREFAREELVYAAGIVTSTLAHRTPRPLVFYQLVIALLEGALDDELAQEAQENGLNDP